MANTKMESIFQFSYATPIFRLQIRVISDLKINYNYLSYLDEMFHTKRLKSVENNSDIIYQISDATPKLDCSLGYLATLIFSCLVLGAYLFFDLVYCLVGSTRRTSFLFL